ncbi:MAG: FecR domain-containing protein [Phycisphaeraceae bacterium]|nr:FecR domain-containing protein [Phycisphaeraceae bacterium]
MADPTRLIHDYLDGELDAERTDRLQEWICRDPANAETFARQMVLHQQIRDRLRTDLYSDTVRTLVSPCVRQAGLSSPRVLRWAAVGRWAAVFAAAVGLLAYLLWPVTGSPHMATTTVPVTPAPTVATLLKADHALISGMGHVAAGRTLPASSDLRLLEGVVQFRMSSGAEVILEAPAEFRLTENNRMRLLRGRLSASVPERANGFTVDAPTVQVVDLSTAFGVEVDEAQETDVHVFEGEVETTALVDSKKLKPQRIRKRQAKRFGRRRNSPIREASGEADRFLRSLPLTHGVAHIRGPVRFQKNPPPAVVPGARENNRHVLLFPERRGVVVDESVIVSFTDPGRYRHLRKHAHPLESGVRVRSYLLHVDPIGDRKTGSALRRTGSITFREPVLGVIAATDLLEQTHDAFGHPRTRYGVHQSGGLDDKDVIRLSRNRRTVRFNLKTRPHIDQIRILVADPA